MSWAWIARSRGALGAPGHRAFSPPEWRNPNSGPPGELAAPTTGETGMHFQREIPRCICCSLQEPRHCRRSVMMLGVVPGAFPNLRGWSWRPIVSFLAKSPHPNHLPRAHSPRHQHSHERHHSASRQNTLTRCNRYRAHRPPPTGAASELRSFTTPTYARPAHRRHSWG
jgi:hypothetical protein